MIMLSEEIARLLLKKQQEAKNWRMIDLPELYNFIALTMLMPHVKKSHIKKYWSTDNLIGTPVFSKIMARVRYLQILFCIRSKIF